MPHLPEGRVLSTVFSCTLLINLCILILLKSNFCSPVYCWEARRGLSHCGWIRTFIGSAVTGPVNDASSAGDSESTSLTFSQFTATAAERNNTPTWSEATQWILWKIYNPPHLQQSSGKWSKRTTKISGHKILRRGWLRLRFPMSGPGDPSGNRVMVPRKNKKKLFILLKKTVELPSQQFLFISNPLCWLGSVTYLPHINLKFIT